MKISKVKISRNPGVVWIKFDSGLFIPYSIDDVVREKIQSGIDIDDNRLIEIINSSMKFLLIQYGLRQVAISPKVAAVLKPKLIHKAREYQHKYHIPESVIDTQSAVDSTLKYLTDQHLLNTADFVRSFINRNSKKSSYFIRESLVRLGIDQSSVEIELPVSDEDKIMSIISRKIDRIGRQPTQKDKTKLLSSIVRKGFSVSTVKKLIDDCLKNR